MPSGLSVLPGSAPDRARARFVADLARTLSATLGDLLAGVYVSGSLAFGDYVEGASDIDVLAVTSATLDDFHKRLLAAAVLREARTCPARGLELVVYAATRLRAVERSWRQGDGRELWVPFELDVNAGPRMPASVAFSPAGRARHWYVLDVSIAQEHAIAVRGPAALAAFPQVPRPVEAAALDGALVWYARRLPAHPTSVLTACRAWRRVAAGEWSSKRAAAAWARRRAPARGALIADAVDRYKAGLPMPSTTAVIDLLWEVRGTLTLAAA